MARGVGGSSDGTGDAGRRITREMIGVPAGVRTEQGTTGRIAGEIACFTWFVGAQAAVARPVIS
jgi:hypothetical protein